MLEDGEWGTQCEIYGAATLLGVDIYTWAQGLSITGRMVIVVSTSISIGNEIPKLKYLP